MSHIYFHVADHDGYNDKLKDVTKTNLEFDSNFIYRSDIKSFTKFFNIISMFIDECLIPGENPPTADTNYFLPINFSDTALGVSLIVGTFNQDIEGIKDFSYEYPSGLKYEFPCSVDKHKENLFEKSLGIDLTYTDFQHKNHN